MPRKQTQIKLFGILKDGTKAKTQQAKQVVMFVNDKKSIQVTRSKIWDNLKVITDKGGYTLTPTGSENVYSVRTRKDIIIHVSLRKLVGKLIYWEDVEEK